MDKPNYEAIRVEANKRIHKEYPLIEHPVQNAYYVEVILKVYEEMKIGDKGSINTLQKE